MTDILTHPWEEARDSIAAQFRGHEAAAETYDRAMDLTPADERAAA